MNVNLKKMVALFALSGTIDFTLVGCHEKQKINMPSFQKEEATSLEIKPWKRSLAFSSVMRTFEELKEKVEKELIPYEEDLSYEPIQQEPMIAQMEKEQTIITDTIKMKPSSIFDKELGVDVYALQEGAILQEEDYKILHDYLVQTKSKELFLSGINVEQFDFSKLDGKNIETLYFDSCQGKVDLEGIRTWKKVSQLGICKTDFRHLDAATALKRLVLNQGEKDDDFSLSEPLEDILIEAGKTPIECLSLSGIPVSYVPIPLNELTLDYADLRNIPETLICSAESLKIYRKCEENDILFPSISIINNALDKKELVCYYLDFRSQPEFDWNSYKHVFLDSCRLSGSVEQMAEYPNVAFSTVTFNNEKEYVYSTKEKEDEIAYIREHNIVIKETLFQREKEKEKVNSKK